VEKNLPARPNLDHLRRQAKALLSALKARDPQAIATFQEHLPAAKSMTADQVLAAPFRLADAHSAIARKSGFDSWPHLARHVEQLRALEGQWEFKHLEIDGNLIPAAGLANSCLLIDGDRFRTESPGTIYEGIFNINVETDPHEIDIEFVEGPEAGNWNYGIYRLDGDQLQICLDMTGKPRPVEFRSAKRNGVAYEILTRTSHARPQDVNGGTASSPKPSVPNSSSPSADRSAFDFVDSPSLRKLQGEWSAVTIVRDGQELPKMMLRTGLRSATQNEIRITFGGQTMIHALVRLKEQTDPIEVDYYNLDAPIEGTTQHGLFKWIGEEACFCMAAPGQPRPADFTCPPGSGRTLSQWRPKK